MTAPATANPRASLHGPTLPPVRPGEVRELSVGADMRTPTADEAKAVRVTAATAVTTAKAVAPLPEFVSGSSRTRLMWYSNAFGTARADGSFEASVPSTLSWIVTFDDTPALVVPPANYTGKLPDMACQYTVVIDARRGTQVEAYDVCQPVQ